MYTCTNYSSTFETLYSELAYNKFMDIAKKIQEGIIFNRITYI